MNRERRMMELKEQISIYSNKLDEAFYEQQGYFPEEDNNYSEEYVPNKIDDLSDKVSTLESEYRKLEYEIEEELRREEVARIDYREGYIIRDSESFVDYLSRTQQALELSKLIANKKTLSPLTLGIYGLWGEGKSTFLRLIERELDGINMRLREDKSIKNQYNKTHVVRFDASEYNDQDKIWFSILSQLFTKYESEKGILAKIQYGFELFKKSIRENPWYIVINIILIILFLAWTSIFIKSKSIIEVIKENALYINLLGLLSTVTVATNIVIPLLKKITSFTKPMSDKIINQLKYPDFKSRLGTREHVKESLNLLIKTWTKNKGDKIVIMVDELDRCSEKTIVEFFEALQLLLPIESIVHVITINQEAVCYALANNNMHFFDKEIVSNKEKLEFGQKYLEKYITIPFQLPSEKIYENYINHLLEDKSDSTINLFNGVEKYLLINIIEEVSKDKIITPREMKKIINLLLLSKERIMNIYKDEKNGHVLKFEEFITWFLLKHYYPNTANSIIRYLKNNYNYNRFKQFKFIRKNLLITSEINEILDTEKSRIHITRLDNIRIEYIILSDKLSETLVVLK